MLKQIMCSISAITASFLVDMLARPSTSPNYLFCCPWIVFVPIFGIVPEMHWQKIGWGLWRYGSSCWASISGDGQGRKLSGLAATPALFQVFFVVVAIGLWLVVNLAWVVGRLFLRVHDFFGILSTWLVICTRQSPF